MSTLTYPPLQDISQKSGNAARHSGKEDRAHHAILVHGYVAMGCLAHPKESKKIAIFNSNKTYTCVLFFADTYGRVHEKGVVPKIRGTSK